MAKRGERLPSVPTFLKLHVARPEAALAVCARTPGFERLPVRWNSRLRSCAGRLTHTRTFPHEPILIELNPALKSEPEELRATFLHEVGHALAMLRDVDDGHGPAWRACVRELGDPRPTRLHLHKSIERTMKKKLAALCFACGKELKRTRYYARGSKWRCGRCGGTLLTDPELLRRIERGELKPVRSER